MHLESPDGEYKLGYNQAIQLCKDNGARIATKAELKAAYNQGELL